MFWCQRGEGAVRQALHEPPTAPLRKRYISRRFLTTPPADLPLPGCVWYSKKERGLTVSTGLQIRKVAPPGGGGVVLRNYLLTTHFVNFVKKKSAGPEITYLLTPLQPYLQLGRPRPWPEVYFLDTATTESLGPGRPACPCPLRCCQDFCRAG